MTKKLKPFSMYYLSWLDSSMVSNGWEFTKDTCDIDMICETCGFYIKESKNFYFFSLNKDTTNESCAQMVQVPKVAVICIKEVK